MAGAGDIGDTLPIEGSRGVVRRALFLLRDGSEAGRSRRFAAGAFLVRVANAGLGFVTQIGLARWMGERDYGLYSSAWVALLVVGGIMSLGLPVAALKLVPDYRERGDQDGLRGFLDGSRRLGALPGLLVAILAGFCLWMLAERIGPIWGVAALALAAVPIYVLTDIQTGIARALDYAALGLAADYLIRPALLMLLAAILFVCDVTGTATTVMLTTLAAVVATVIGQGIALERRLRRDIPSGARRIDIRRWAEISWPLLVVTGFTLLLSATDILVLQLFVPPEEIAVYFAATKIVAIASFVSYGVANTSAHRFAAQFARDDRDGMKRLAAETVRWTFWPTLAVSVLLSALAIPLLWLFGPAFTSGAPLCAILAAGLVAAAAVGPADRALAMADHGRATATIYGLSFVANVLLCLALVPWLGLPGAALGTALAMGLKALLLFVETRRRLGITMSIFTPGST